MQRKPRLFLQALRLAPVGELAEKIKDQQRFMAVLSEVAAMGQEGLQINEPGTSRSLKTLPGSWSDLALACLIHVGM